MPAYCDNGRWRYRKRLTLPSGKRTRIKGTPATNTKAAAEAAERAHIQRVLNPDARPATPHKEVPTLREYMTPFLQFQSSGDKPSSVTAKEQILAAYLVPRFGDWRLDSFRQQDVDAFVADLLADGGRGGEGRSRKTVNNILTVLGSLLGYAATNRVIDPVGLTFFIDNDEAEMWAVSSEEFDALLAVTTDKRYRVGLLLGRDAGLRVGEIRALDRTDVNEVRRQVHVARSIDPKNRIGPTKNRKRRTVPMTTRLRDALAELTSSLEPTGTRLEGGAPLMYRLRDGARLSYWAMRDGILELYEAAGVKVIGDPWHGLRHAFGTDSAALGVQAKVLMELMGHQSIATTMKYIHTTDDQKRDAIAALEGKTWNRTARDADIERPTTSSRTSRTGR